MKDAPWFEARTRLEVITALVPRSGSPCLRTLPPILPIFLHHLPTVFTPSRLRRVVPAAQTRQAAFLRHGTVSRSSPVTPVAFAEETQRLIQSYSLVSGGMKIGLESFDPPSRSISERRHKFCSRAVTCMRRGSLGYLRTHWLS